jgi:hypothetical protein
MVIPPFVTEMRVWQAVETEGEMPGAAQERFCYGRIVS